MYISLPLLVLLGLFLLPKIMKHRTIKRLLNRTAFEIGQLVDAFEKGTKGIVVQAGDSVSFDQNLFTKILVACAENNVDRIDSAFSMAPKLNNFQMWFLFLTCIDRKHLESLNRLLRWGFDPNSRGVDPNSRNEGLHCLVILLNISDPNFKHLAAKSLIAYGADFDLPVQPDKTVSVYSLFAGLGESEIVSYVNEWRTNHPRKMVS